MNEERWKATLRQEGFEHIYSWEDAPSTFYSDHTHAEITAHVVLSGEITVTCEGRTQTYRAGERFDVPAGAVHSARMGPSGCRYLIGEKHS